MFASVAVQKGQACLVVPTQLCLFHEVDAQEGAPQEGRAAGDTQSRVAWVSEMRLTKEFMELLHNAALDGNGFWAEYWWLLPNVDCKIPCNIPRSAVEDLSAVDPRLSSALLSHRAQLRGETLSRDFL